MLSTRFISQKGVYYIDLITDNSPTPSRDEPPLPHLTQPHPPRIVDTITLTAEKSATETEADKVYDVFISHAGTDKFTITLPLCNQRVAPSSWLSRDCAEL